jgi:hypothetical protein
LHGTTLVFIQEINASKDNAIIYLHKLENLLEPILGLLLMIKRGNSFDWLLGKTIHLDWEIFKRILIVSTALSVTCLICEADVMLRSSKDATDWFGPFGNIAAQIAVSPIGIIDLADKHQEREAQLGSYLAGCSSWSAFEN